jgi:hypothetical protein
MVTFDQTMLPSPPPAPPPPSPPVLELETELAVVEPLLVLTVLLVCGEPDVDDVTTVVVPPPSAVLPPEPSVTSLSQASSDVAVAAKRKKQ